MILIQNGLPQGLFMCHYKFGRYPFSDIGDINVMSVIKSHNLIANIYVCGKKNK